MSQTNTQFSVASHIMAALGWHEGAEMRSAELADSVNADPSFVRRVLSKLAKAGLVTTTRGKYGASRLSRPPAKITLLEIYQASEAPAPFALHAYPVAKTCQVSRNMHGCMEGVLQRAQASFEQGLAEQTLADMVKTLKRGR